MSPPGKRNTDSDSNGPSTDTPGLSQDFGTGIIKRTKMSHMKSKIRFDITNVGMNLVRNVGEVARDDKSSARLMRATSQALGEIEKHLHTSWANLEAKFEKLREKHPGEEVGLFKRPSYFEKTEALIEENEKLKREIEELKVQSAVDKAVFDREMKLLTDQKDEYLRLLYRKDLKKKQIN